MRRIRFVVVAFASLLVLYLLAWPVPVEPVAWTAPPNPGYTGPFLRNERLTAIETLSLGGDAGPEEVAVDADGRIYASTHGGHIVRLDPEGRHPERWASTGGRPLGIDFDASGNLMVADAFRGLLSIAPDGTVRELATVADGVPIRYADDVDVAADGRIYFTDASTKFGAASAGDTYDASLLDLLEHGGHGRLLRHDPRTGATTTLLDGLNFANGVAVAPDQTHVLVSETGRYRVLRLWIDGSTVGRVEPVIEALPGFPDNISTGLDGRFWIALVSPRNRLLDALSNRPGLRKVIQRLPAFLRPDAVAYGHVVAIDGNGRVVEDLQDPKGTYPIVTSAVETPAFLYLGSLVAPVLGRVPRGGAGP